MWSLNGTRMNRFSDQGVKCNSRMIGLDDDRCSDLTSDYKPAPLPFFNPSSPHDALKHHFTSQKTDLIFLKQRVLGRTFP